MKKIFLSALMFLIVSFSYAQKTDSTTQKLDTSIVKLTTKSKIQTIQLKNDKFILNDSTGQETFQVLLYKSKQAGESKTVVLELNDISKKLGCVSENDVIEVFFKDGTKMDLYQSGFYNCKGKTVMHFRGTWGGATKIEELKGKFITSVKVNAGGTSVQAKFSDAQSKDFKKALKNIDDYPL